MDFAREHLKQLGWQEGDGLGKERLGIVEALKPRLKFDMAGIGHDPAKEFTHTWWSEAYNSAAKSITVTEAMDGCELVAKPKKKKKKKVKTFQSTYNNFVTGGLLIGDQTTEYGASAEETTVQTVEAAVALRLSDDQLLAACGGRTAHKGARHGHKMDGKLARIMAQEAEIVARLTSGLAGGEQTITKKKKKRKHAEMEESQPEDVQCELSNPESDQLKTKKKKKRQEDPDPDPPRGAAGGVQEKKKKDPDADAEEPTNAAGADDDALSTEKKKKKKKRKADRES